MSAPSFEQVVADSLENTDTLGWLLQAVDTEQASQEIGEPVPSLQTKRLRGGGPIFCKANSKVTYIRLDLLHYLYERRRASTSDTKRASAKGADLLPFLERLLERRTLSVPDK